MSRKLCLVFLLLLALYLTYPVWLHPSEFLLRADVPEFPGDFLLYRSYVVHFQNFFLGESPLGSLEHGYYPDGVSCADAECSPMFAVPAGLLSFAAGPVGALNLLMVLFVFLSGVALFLLAREFMGQRAALVSAALFLTSNYFLAEMMDGHLNLLQFFWMILSFLFLERLLKGDGEEKWWLNPVLLGLALVGQAYASTQYLLFLALMLPLYLLLRNPKTLKDKEFWKGAGLVVIVFAVFALPYLLNFTGGQAKERNLAENMFFSVGLPGNEFSYPLLNIRYAFSAFAPVYILLPLLFAGGVLLLSKKVRVWQLPFLVLALLAFILSLGPISPAAPYYFLYRFVPFFSSMRTPSRFYLFVVLFLSLIGGGIIDEVEKKLGKIEIESLPVVGLLATILVLSLFSPYAAAHYTVPISDFEADGLYEYLGTLPEGTVVEYPNLYNCEYLYHAEIHGKPLLGGCAAFPPDSYYAFIESCGIELLSLPSADCRDRVREHGIRYVVYHSERYESGFEEFIFQQPGLGLLAESGTYYLFEVLPDEF